MTTIKLKNGSGAPLAGDLVQGEPALDLTNKRFYTEDSGGTVIEVGTNPSTIDINAGTIDGTVIGGSSAAAGTFTTFTSTGIDDNATSTAITIDSSENVGIGISSPSQKLDVKGSIEINSESTASSGDIDKLRFRKAHTAGVGTGTYTIGEIRSFTDNGYSGGLDFYTGKSIGGGSYASTFAMRIDSSGRVGIGTTNPLRDLQIGTPGSSATATISLQTNTSGTASIYMGDSTGVGEYAGLIRYSNNDNSLRLWTSSAERMRINSSGNVGIGTTNPGWRLHVHNTQSGYVAGYFTSQSSSTTEYGLLINLHNDPNDATRYFLVGRGNNNQTTRFHVASNGNVTNTNNSYGSISDEKLKENIVDSGSQWEDIKALRVRKYSMKEDALDAPNKLGVIAQEVEAAGMQGLVIDSTDMDENNNDLGTITKTVNYSILYMKAVKALQEAMDRIETLETEVAALKGA